jgi:ribose transport system ATP-binding protein
MNDIISFPNTISVVNAKKYFGPTKALDGCSFSARVGEIHAIVGGNGCGKSTLAKVISGILPIDSGSVVVLGETPSTPKESRNSGISTVYQEVLVADESTVVDNIFMGSDYLFSKKLPFTEKVRKASQLMKELSGECVDPFELVGNLPLGLKQWITIARALLSEPKVLILDESSAALDFDSTERLFAKMRLLRDGGTTVLVVTHRIAELIRISDRATVLRDGRDVGVLEREEITEKNLLALITGEEVDPEHRLLKAPQPDTDRTTMLGNAIRVWPRAKAFDFELRAGEIVGIAGLDGQGQDEFVRILAGVSTAVGGSVLACNGDGIQNPVFSLGDAVKNRIVYVSGDRKKEGIFPSLSIFENLVVPLYREKKRAGILGIIDLQSLRSIFKRETANLMIKFGEASDKITSLSGGNQQKVLIGRGFALRPNTIVLNDPARGIDVGAKSELYKHLRSFAEEGKSVIYMSSELEEFVGFATRVIVFRDGTPFDAFDGRNLNPKSVLEAMFGQTDGSGLTQRFGLTPSLANGGFSKGDIKTRGPETGTISNTETNDGVRFVVKVPDNVKPMKRSRETKVKISPLVKIADYSSQKRNLKNASISEDISNLPAKKIKVVEFDEKGRPRHRGVA